MCDFDITSFREKATTTTAKKAESDKAESSFSLYLKKRKMMGLDDSDSDSDDDNKDTIDAQKKQKPQQNNVKYETTHAAAATSAPAPTPTPAPASEPTFSSPLDTELARLAQEKAAFKKESDLLDELKMTYQQPPIQNASSAPIVLIDDNLTMNRNMNNGNIESSQQTKPRPHTMSLDIDDLDPELANLLLSQDLETSSCGDTQSEKVLIKVTYVSLMETMDPNIKSLIDQLSKPVKIKMLNNSPFDTLMEQYCKKKRLNMQDMVLVYENIPVILRTTPASLSMSTTSTNKMEVYKRSDFDKKVELEKEQTAARLSQYNNNNSDDDDDGYNSPEPEKQQENFLHIKLRGKDNKDIGLRVKPTTRIDSIIKQYIKLMELDIALEKIHLSFEGETLETSMIMADTDLEDEDMISVIIHS